MAKINIKQGDCKAPKTLAQAIVEGQTLPFTATLKHTGKKPLVVPSSGITGLIPPGEPVSVKIKGFDQAWLLVTDLATYAALAGNEEPDFATIETPEVVEEPAPVAEVPAKSAKAGKNEGVTGQ